MISVIKHIATVSSALQLFGCFFTIPVCSFKSLIFDISSISSAPSSPEENPPDIYLMWSRDVIGEEDFSKYKGKKMSEVVTRYKSVVVVNGIEHEFM